jgi:hypothetical protein
MIVFVAVFAMVLAYVALVAAYFALRTLAKLRRATAALGRTAEGRGASLVEATERTAAANAVLGEQVTELREHVTELREHVTELVSAARGYVDERCADAIRSVAERAGEQPGAIRNLALVRYDAFREMSGRMSFSLALLDDAGDGVAISAVCGAGDTRVYAKAVADGRGEHELSPEEQQAVAAALHRGKGLLHRKAG